MTETGMNTSNPYDGERRGGTVGMPLPGVEARVVDDADKPLPAGERPARRSSSSCGSRVARASTCGRSRWAG